MQRILLIDDDQNLLRVTQYNLKAAGFQVQTAASGHEGLTILHSDTPDVVVTDVKLGDINGLDLLAAIKQEAPDIPVIVITAYGSIDMAVAAIKQGAFNFITKPFDRETLRAACTQALELVQLKEQNLRLAEEVNRLTGAQGMETSNPAMQALLDTALTVADSDATVLITGESGTGKEVLARLIHQNSPRRKKPFVAVNCAAIPETLIESELFGHVKGAFTGATSSRKGRFMAAHTGTLFLDEISELKTDMQAKMLRVIQEREVEPVGSEKRYAIDIRIIAASNKALDRLTPNREFREDLYYRLSVVPLHLPPLRERREDIPMLVQNFLQKIGAPATIRFSDQARRAMMRYSWPGNIRELQNTIERCVILRRGPVIEAADLDLATSAKPAVSIAMDIPDEGLALEAVERDLIQRTLAKCGGNRTQAARLLKIPRHVLLYRLKKFDL
jgi:DNA-binding NtrC family response regulator